MLELHDITVVYGEKTVLSDCSLSVADGERVALMGPSGCGKTTLLRVALSLQTPLRGTVNAGTGRHAAVFQEPRLLPWYTALENVNAVLSDKQGTLPEALLWLDRLGLGDAANLYPAELSGGMQQRVSIARALCSQPELLVLDEPFRGLDDALHARVLDVVSSSLPHATILLATHREEEALALGCRVLRFCNGRFI